MPSIPSISKEYIYTNVTALADPTPVAVEFNFTALGVEPTSGWVAGSWDGTATDIGNGLFRARARILVGAGTSFPLANGTYWVWVRVNSTPEAPVRRVGDLHIS